jgi:hypothetical protein
MLHECAGTGVMILKIVSPKTIGKKWRFLLITLLNYAKIGSYVMFF